MSTHVPDPTETRTTEASTDKARQHLATPDDSAKAGSSINDAASNDAALRDLATAREVESVVGARPPFELPDAPRLPKGNWGRRFLFDWSAWRIEIGTLGLSLLVALCFVPQVLNFSGRNEFRRDINALAPLWQPLESMEYRLYNARFTARGPQIRQRSLDRIAIVAIDQSSLSAMGQWPWPRAWHAALIRRLKKAGARVIAIDIDFSDRQFPTKDRLGAPVLSRGDRELVAATEAAGNVIYPTQISAQQGEQLATSLTITPYEELDSVTPDVSLAYFPLDSDGAARRYPVRAHVNGSDLGSFATLAAAIYRGQVDGDENPEYYRALKSLQIPLASTLLQDNRIWMTPINFMGPPGTFKTYSYSDVLRGQGRGWSDAALKEKFGNRIVYVGATAHILKDLFAAPTYVSRTGEETEAVMAGVEIHATATAMLLDNAYIHTVSTTGTLGTLFALTLGCGLLMAMSREAVSRAARWAQGVWAHRNLPGRVHSMVWFACYATLAIGPVIAFWWLASRLFAARGLWIIAVYPILSALISSGLALVLLFVVESGERRKTVARLSRHVSPDVMEEILAQPEEYQARPFRARATVLFSDLEGFTTYAESHEPEQVVESLNAYMSRMVPIVESYGGTLDKFIGDALMAFFGAPIPRHDHAARALRCSIEMQEECARFRQETGIAFYTRIGIGTGDLIVGYMGSRERADYTVIGDTVNLASRLESKNKEFGSWIMCSAQTQHDAPDVARVESVSTSVQGKAEPVDVFIVRGLKGEAPADHSWGRAALDAQSSAMSVDAARLDPSSPDSLPDSLPLALPRGDGRED